MKNIKRRESPRIDIHAEALIAWRSSASLLPLPALGQIIPIEIELPADRGFGQKCNPCQGLDFRSFYDRIPALEALQPVANGWGA